MLEPNQSVILSDEFLGFDPSTTALYDKIRQADLEAAQLSDTLPLPSFDVWVSEDCSATTLLPAYSLEQLQTYQNIMFGLKRTLFGLQGRVKALQPHVRKWKRDTNGLTVDS